MTNKFVEEGISKGKYFDNINHLEQRLLDFHKERTGGATCLVCKTDEFAVSLGDGVDFAHDPRPNSKIGDIPVKIADPSTDSYELACLNCGYRMRFWYLPFSYWESSIRD